MREYRIRQAGSLDGLILAEGTAVEPGPGEVLVGIKAAAINPRDLMVVYDRYVHAIPKNLVPLSDGAGEIIAVGPAVTRCAVGDRVATTTLQRWIAGPRKPYYSGSGLGGSIDGVLREQGVFREDGVVLIPDHLDYVQAAAFGLPALASWAALTAGRPLRPGDAVLVQGSGNVALITALIAPLFGARVMAVTRSAEKRDRLARMGIDLVIDSTVTPDWVAVARDWNGAGIDRIVEVIGPTMMDRSMAALAANGHISLVGSLGGPGSFNPMAMVGRGITMEGIAGGSAQQLSDALQAAGRHGVVPIVDRVFGFDEALSAFRDTERPDRFGRTVVSMEY